MIKDNPDYTRMEIASKLGTTKNSIAGQVHRLQKKGLLEVSPQAAFRQRNSPQANRERMAREQLAREQTNSIRPLKAHRKSRAKTESKPKPKTQHPQRSHKRSTLQANVSAGGDRLPRTPQELAIIRKRKSNHHALILASGVADKLLATRGNQCKYLHKDTTDPDCHFCEENRLKGASYCKVHTDMCKTPLRPTPGTKPHYRTS